MKEKASGFIKLEFVGDALRVDARLKHIGIEEKDESS